MSRLSAIALSVTAALVVVACADNILKERPAMKAASKTTVPSFSVSGALAKRQSTTCAAYRRQLLQIQTAKRQLGALTRDQYQARELTLNALIADVCE
jgi:hypothetical protein